MPRIGEPIEHINSIIRVIIISLLCPRININSQLIILNGRNPSQNPTQRNININIVHTTVTVVIEKKLSVCEHIRHCFHLAVDTEFLEGVTIAKHAHIDPV